MWVTSLVKRMLMIKYLLLLAWLCGCFESTTGPDEEPDPVVVEEPTEPDEEEPSVMVIIPEPEPGGEPMPRLRVVGVAGWTQNRQDGAIKFGKVDLWNYSLRLVNVGNVDFEEVWCDGFFRYLNFRSYSSSSFVLLGAAAVGDTISYTQSWVYRTEKKAYWGNQREYANDAMERYYEDGKPDENWGYGVECKEGLNGYYIDVILNEGLDFKPDP